MDKPREIPDEILLEGRRDIVAAIKSGRKIKRLMKLEGLRDKSLNDLILGPLRESGTKIETADRSRLDSISPSGKHQGVIAWTGPYQYSSVDDLLRKAEGKNEDPFIFILDGIEDPHNLGAIIRTAECCGAHGVIIRQVRAAGVSSGSIKASAGAINYIGVASVTNLPRALEKLKERGLWIYCADMDGKPIYRQDLKGPVGLVIGNEGKGVSRLVREKCDLSLSVPMYGHTESLNASVAAAVLAYEVVRQRHFV